MGKIFPKNSPKGAWIGTFKPKRQNFYIAISPELLIRLTSDLRSEFRPQKALRGWSAITPKQMQHGWRPPSWKSISRHISAADVPIWTKYGSRMRNDTPITEKWSRSKPEVEFQYGGRLYLETGSSYISAANWDVNVNVTAFMYHAGLITQLWTAALMRGALMRSCGDIWTKFGFLIDFDLMKAVTSTNTKPKVVFSGSGRHL